MGEVGRGETLRSDLKYHDPYIKSFLNMKAATEIHNNPIPTQHRDHTNTIASSTFPCHGPPPS